MNEITGEVNMVKEKKVEEESFLPNQSEKTVPKRQSSTDSNKEKKDQILLQRWKSFAIVLIVLDILLLVIALTVTIVWMNDSNERVSLPYPQEYCLPKKAISLQVDDDKTNFKNCTTRIEDGVEVCCMSTQEGLQQLVDLYVTRRYREDQVKNAPLHHCPMQSLTGSSKNQSAARVVGKIGSVPDLYGSSIVRWDSKSNKSFVNSRVSYDDNQGTFTVAKKGFYYIYSQVTFMEMNMNMSNSPSSDLDRSMYTSLCHFVYRKRPNMPDGHHEKLLESSQSKCQLQTRQSNSTSYIGAVFYLDEEEQIMVKVTDPDKISGSEYSNYFGLHMI
uniref:Putative tumor necrosis factor ligand superfamily member 10-like protein n=1 Tax=Pinctada fucata TaxID=50426 RepID=A0A194AN86_PINFU